jgi:hypothetical protein
VAIETGISYRKAKTMNRAELLHCMRNAAALLADFRHIVPQHSPEAYRELARAREHFDRAVVLLCRPSTPFDPHARPPRFRNDN